MQSIPVFVLAAALSAGALAQADKPGTADKEHEAHHPAGAAAPAAAPSAPVAPPAPAQIDMQMKSMREMHHKMMAAKTPAERQAMMAEHMKAMQGVMAMMGRMKAPEGQGGGMPMMSLEMMGKRMDMMETMMQMMLDREAARATAPTAPK